MKKNVLLAVLVLAAAGLVVMVVRQRSDIDELKRNADDATAKLDAVAKRPVVQPVEEPVAAPEPPPVAPAPAPATNSPFAGMAAMMKSPAMKEMVRAQQAAVLNKMYGALSKYLSLPVEKMDALRELLLDRQMAQVDAGLAMMNGTAAERKQAMEDAKTGRAASDQKIQELLGPQDYEVFKQYDETTGERMQVQMFKDALPADAALTEQQEFDLISAMYEERKALPPSALMNNKTADPSQFTPERIDEALKQMELLQQHYADRAGTILSPVQLDQFTKWLQQLNTMQAAGMKMAAQMFGNKAKEPAP